MEIIHTPPVPSSYIPLAEYQSRTPASFHSGPPVLHHKSDRCKVIILEGDLTRAPGLASLGETTVQKRSNGQDEAVNGGAGEDAEVSIEGVDVWVTSEKFLLFTPSTSSGVSIPYPSISLHAIQTLPSDSSTPQTDSSSQPLQRDQGLYMQLVVSPENDEEDDLDTISLTIIPQPGAPTPDSTEPALSETQKLFESLSACSNLHPDPGVEDEEGDSEGLRQSLAFQAGLIEPGANNGGLPPALAAGGWITAENMHDYVDEEGNWIGGGDEEESEELGTGAGTVREREDENGENGSEETKWRRTE